ncbi:MAG: hypothetical protein ABI664_12395 [bacterium]
MTGNAARDPVWATRLLVDTVHYRQLNEHGGSHGTREADALELNGYDVDRADDDIIETIKALAAGTLEEKTLARWFRTTLVPL